MRTPQYQPAHSGQSTPSAQRLYYHPISTSSRPVIKMLAKHGHLPANT